MADISFKIGALDGAILALLCDGEVSSSSGAAKLEEGSISAWANAGVFVVNPNAEYKDMDGNPVTRTSYRFIELVPGAEQRRIEVGDFFVEGCFDEVDKYYGKKQSSVAYYNFQQRLGGAG